MSLIDEQRRLEQAMKFITRACTTLGTKTLDDLNDAMLAQIKASKELTDSQLDSLKSSEDLVAVFAKFKSLATSLEASRRVIDKQNLSLKDAKARLFKDLGLDKKYSARGVKHNKGLAEEKRKRDDEVKRYNDNLKTIDDVKKAYADKIASLTGHTENAAEAAKKLTSVGAVFSKVLDESKGKVAAWSKTTFASGTAIKLLAASAKELYNQSVELANKGLFQSMTTINLSAMQLRMGTKEFIDLIDKNRDTIMSMGGGSVGIENFKSILDQASDGLEIFGKDGKKISADLLSTFNRAGVGYDMYSNNAKKVNDQYVRFNKVFGTTSEEFAEYYGTLVNTQDIQNKLNTGDVAAARQMTAEAIARAENTAKLGLSTKQLTEMNRTLEGLYNPKKNRQAEEIQERQYLKMALRSSSSRRRSEGKDSSDIDVDEKLLDEFLRSGPDKRKDPKFAAVYKAINTADSDIGTAQGGDSVSMAAFDSRHYAENAGLTWGAASKIGGDLKNAHRLGTDNPDAKQNAGINEGKNGLEMTATEKAFSAIRATVDQVTSVLDNPFTKAVWASVVALGALAASATAAALAQGGGKLLGSLGSKAGGLARGAVGMLPAAAGVAAAGGAGWAVGRGIAKLTGSDDAISGWMNKDNDDKVKAMLEGKTQPAKPAPVSGGASMAYRTPSKSSKAQQAASNEAMMESTLTKEGITDPRQRAIIMGQLAHESMGFRATTEIGSESYFQKYEGKKSLGNTQAGDGSKFRGRGFIQLTGRSNYEQAGKSLGLDLVNNPELAADPENASKIAMWYMKSRKSRATGMNTIEAAAAGNMVDATRTINGGMNGFADRDRYKDAYLDKYTRVDTSSVSDYATKQAVAAKVAPPPVQNDPTADMMREQNALLARIATNTVRQQDIVKADRRELLENN